MSPLFEDFGGGYHVGVETGVELGLFLASGVIVNIVNVPGGVGETAGRSLHEIPTMVRNAQCHVSLPSHRDFFPISFLERPYGERQKG